MNKELVSQWNKNKELLRASFEEKAPESYDDIFKRLFEVVLIDKKYSTDKITVIDDGDYQGTRIFIIPDDSYQPSESDYLVCAVSYGSCSGCDTFQSIMGDQWGEEKLSEEQVKDLMMLALHMVQGTKPLFANEYVNN